MEIPYTPLKLLVDTKNRKVIFAEARKDFVDFLFSLLSFPVGALNARDFPVTKIVTVGCLANLHSSIARLQPDYMLPGYNYKTNPFKKIPIRSDSLEEIFGYMPRSCGSGSIISPIIPMKTIYKCSDNACASYMTDMSSTVCPDCYSRVMNIVAYEFPSTEEEGYVRGNVTYMVTDDLVVKPMFALSFISSFNSKSSGFENFASLEVKEINFSTTDQAMKIFKAAMQSKTVLTDVFYENPIV